MFLVSFLYSNLGLGGGMLYVPIMVFIAISMKRLEIIPISLFLSFMTQLPAVYTHYKKDLVKFKLGISLGIATVPGVMLGIFFGLRSGDALVYGLFALLLILTGIKMINDIYKNKFNFKSEDQDYSTNRLIVVFFISILTGLVSAFFGVGGGLVTVPVLIYILGLYPRRAIGTSALVIVITSLIGFICYSLLSLDCCGLPDLFTRSVPAIDYSLAIILGIVVMIGAYIGSSWGLKSLKTKSIQMIFIVIIFFVGVQMFLRALGYI
jgi:uncharacterized membrane protein YfcA